MTSTAIAVPISFEFFPPNTPVGSEKLKAVVRRARRAASPSSSASPTAPAARRTTRRSPTVADIAAARPGRGAAPVVRRLDARQHRARSSRTYRAQQIRRLVALRGDLPSGTATAGEFRYASELIAFIRETQGRDWHIEVAAYPEFHPQAALRRSATCSTSPPR